MTKNVSAKQLAIITAIAAVALVGIWYLALFKPQTHKLAATRKADTAAKAQIAGLQDQVGQLQALEKQIPADRVKLAHYQQAIPSNPQVSTAIRDIQSAASSTGVALTSLAPAVPGAGSTPTKGVAGATTIPVTISSSGSYTALMAFVQDLSSMPRTMVIKSLSIGGVGNAMTASIAAEMYFTGK